MRPDRGHLGTAAVVSRLATGRTVASAARFPWASAHLDPGTPITTRPGTAALVKDDRGGTS